MDQEQQLKARVHLQHPASVKGQMEAMKRIGKISPQPGKSQLSSFILFASLIVLINLCPFDPDLDEAQSTIGLSSAKTSVFRFDHKHHNPSASCLTYLRSSFDFVKLMFSQPSFRLNKRTTRFTQAKARVLGKMAKVWYIKKKIKKLSKKLKKHTIAVPVFTAIPIYEHSYYPPPHVTHVSHGGMHHAAASSYAPATVAQMTGASSSTVPIATTGPAQQQQMVTSASSQHQVATAYRMPPHRAYGSGGMYQPSASAHHIINAYAPSPPLFVDDTGGLYGHYGNAYGRYDGGYHVW